MIRNLISTTSYTNLGSGRASLSFAKRSGKSLFYTSPTKLNSFQLCFAFFPSSLTTGTFASRTNLVAVRCFQILFLTYPFHPLILSKWLYSYYPLIFCSSLPQEYVHPGSGIMIFGPMDFGLILN